MGSDALFKPRGWDVAPGLVDPRWRWAWRELKIALPFWHAPTELAEGVGSFSQDVVSGVPAKVLQGADIPRNWRTPYDWGPGGSADGDNVYVDLDDNFLPEHSRGADTNGTILLILARHFATAAGEGVFHIGVHDANTNAFVIRKGASGDLYEFDLRAASIDRLVFTIDALGTLHERNVIVFSVGPQRGGNAVWVNGAKQSPSYTTGSASTTDWLSLISATHDGWSILREWTGGTPDYWPGSVHLYAQWSRAFTDRECELISRNPWGFLRPARTAINLPQAAAAAGLPVWDRLHYVHDRTRPARTPRRRVLL